MTPAQEREHNEWVVDYQRRCKEKSEKRKAVKPVEEPEPVIFSGLARIKR